MLYACRERAHACWVWCAQCTRLQVEASQGGRRSLAAAAKPGCFFFVNIPAVSRTQWHPISVLSCPTAPVPLPRPAPAAPGEGAPELVPVSVGPHAQPRDSLSFLIKGMGPSTWSGRVCRLAREQPALLRPRLRGPHGDLGGFHALESPLVAPGGGDWAGRRLGWAGLGWAGLGCAVMCCVVLVSRCFCVY